MVFVMPSRTGVLLATLFATFSLLLLNRRIFHAMTEIPTTEKRSSPEVENKYNYKYNNRNSNLPGINSPQTSDTATVKEILPTYTLQSPLSSLPLVEPTHLTPIPPSFLVPLDNHPIDVTHRRGWMHVGHCLFVMDDTGKLLFLKRSNEVVTCPNTWSIVGEHSVVGEANDGWDVVFRALFEELGLIVTVDGDGVGWKEGNTHEKDADERTKHPIVPATIRNVTHYPLYYVRHYGPRKDNRVDRQVTYLWLVHLHKPREEIEWTLDEEVADHKWISLGEFEEWLSDDEEEMRSSEAEFGDGAVDGVKDDGPPHGDFCHWTIRTLYQAGLKGLKQIIFDENF
ncbi:hypothetical protein ACHAXS_013528 [Conticribra weissflogii]